LPVFGASPESVNVPSGVLTLTEHSLIGGDGMVAGLGMIGGVGRVAGSA
jgi:hypothetical protein